MNEATEFLKPSTDTDSVVTLPVKKITVSHRHMLDAIQAVTILKAVNEQAPTVDNDEVEQLGDLLHLLIDTMHTDEHGSSIQVNTKQLFSIWLCLDSYLECCKQMPDTNERRYAVDLRNAFSRPASE